MHFILLPSGAYINLAQIAYIHGGDFVVETADGQDLCDLRRNHRLDEDDLRFIEAHLYEMRVKGAHLPDPESSPWKQ